MIIVVGVLCAVIKKYKNGKALKITEKNDKIF